MIDPNNLPIDTEVGLHLPKLIVVDDYHEFAYHQQFINKSLGIDDVYVTEVGFVDGQYVGLVHTDCEHHNQLVLQLDAHYKEQEE